jgi:hypothetical protein
MSAVENAKEYLATYATYFGLEASRAIGSKPLKYMGKIGGWGTRIRT